MTIAWPDGTRKRDDSGETLAQIAASLAGFVENITEVSKTEASLEANTALATAITQLVAAQNKQSAMLSDLMECVARMADSVSAISVKSPDVYVDAPEIPAAQISLDQPPAPPPVFPKKVTKRIVRDPNGYIDHVDEEWSY